MVVRSLVPPGGGLHEAEARPRRRLTGCAGRFGFAAGVGQGEAGEPRPVIASGFFTRLLIGVLFMPALQARVARPTDRMEV